MRFTITLSRRHRTKPILDFQPGSGLLLRVAPLGVSGLTLSQCDLLVDENVILLFLDFVDEVVMGRCQVGLGFEGLFDLFALHQTLNDLLKTLLALDHGFDDLLLALSMILGDVALECFRTTAWDLNFDLVVLFVSSLADLMVQIDLAGTNQVLLSPYVNYRNGYVVLLDEFEDFGVQQVASAGLELDRSLAKDLIANLLNLLLGEFRLSLSRSLIFGVCVHRWVQSIVMIWHLEVA